MAIAVANSWIITGSTSVTVSGFQAGDLCVVVAAEFRDAGPSIGPVSDNGSNTYTDRKQNADTETFRSTCLISDAVVSTPPTSVSVGNAHNIVVLRVTGAAEPPFDVGNLSQVTGDDPAFPTVTMTADGLLVVGATHDGGGTSLDPPSGFTLAKEEESASTNPIIVAYKVASAGAQSGTWITGGSRDWSMVTAAYKSAVIAASPTPFPQILIL